MIEMSHHILVIEDDQEIAKIIGDYLEREGYRTSIQFDGLQGYETFKIEQPDLLIVDLMLPSMDGFDICQKVREDSAVPIIVVSARQSDIDKIHSLGLGADDYVTKPFSPLELVARVKSHLRRYQRYQGQQSERESLLFDGLEIQVDSRIVMKDGESVNLTAKEYDLLIALAKYPEKVFTKEQLYQHVWKQDDLDDIRTVTVHIKNLRHKLGDGTRFPRFIDTVWGVGYKFIGQKYEDS